jgi:hypothetical protein
MANKAQESKKAIAEKIIATIKRTGVCTRRQDETLMMLGFSVPKGAKRVY